MHSARGGHFGWLISMLHTYAIGILGVKYWASELPGIRVSTWACSFRTQSHLCNHHAMNHASFTNTGLSYFGWLSTWGRQILFGGRGENKQKLLGRIVILVCTPETKGLNYIILPFAKSLSGMMEKYRSPKFEAQAWIDICPFVVADSL